MDEHKRSMQRQDWLAVGLRVLAAHGHEALKLQRLTAETGVTTGSFYWHFENIEHYRRTLTVYWAEEFVPGLIRKAQELAASPEQELECTGKVIVAENGPQIDTAMRRWAEVADYASEALITADVYRRETLLEMSGKAGTPMNDDKLALFAMAWRGSTDVEDQTERLRLLAKIRGIDSEGP